MPFYEINVSLNGRHLFATAERSLMDLESAKTLWYMFLQKFDTKLGFELRLTEYKTTGKNLSICKDGVTEDFRNIMVIQQIFS